MQLQPFDTIRDDTFTTLAIPQQVGIDTHGRYVVADRSDRDIKVYDNLGHRVATFGQAGRGPGEFSALASGQLLLDSVVVYDLSNLRLTLFAPDGRVGRTLDFSGRKFPLIRQVGVVDDSLLLLLLLPLRNQSRPLIQLADREGSVISEFFLRREYFKNNPRLAQYSTVVADARGGLVFAGLTGGDSLFVFDYQGHSVAAGPIDMLTPLVSLKKLVFNNSGQIVRGSGAYVLDGLRTVIRVVALDSASVAVQIAPYSAKYGIDALSGGTVLVLALDGSGGLFEVGRFSGHAGLLGRDPTGKAILMGYAGLRWEAYEVSFLGMTRQQSVQ